MPIMHGEDRKNHDEMLLARMHLCLYRARDENSCPTGLSVAEVSVDVGCGDAGKLRHALQLLIDLKAVVCTDPLSGQRLWRVDNIRDDALPALRVTNQTRIRGKTVKRLH